MKRVGNGILNEEENCISFGRNLNVANRDGMQKSKKELQLLSVREDASGPFHVGTFD